MSDLDKPGWTRHETGSEEKPTREYGPILDEVMELMTRRFSEMGVDIQDDDGEAVVAVTFSGLPAADTGAPNEAGIGAVAHNDEAIVAHLLGAVLAINESIGRKPGDVLALILGMISRAGGNAPGIEISDDVARDLFRVMADEIKENDEPTEKGKSDEPDVKW